MLLGLIPAGLAASEATAVVAMEAPAGQPFVVRKVPVADCRAVRGFLGAPVDGSLHSRDYRGTVREYPRTASDGVAYSFNRNDELHVTLADSEGFDLVVLRGGAKARLYGNVNALVGIGFS